MSPVPGQQLLVGDQQADGQDDGRDRHEQVGAPVAAAERRRRRCRRSASPRPPRQGPSPGAAAVATAARTTGPGRPARTRAATRSRCGSARRSCSTAGWPAPRWPRRRKPRVTKASVESRTPAARHHADREQTGSSAPAMAAPASREEVAALEPRGGQGADEQHATEDEAAEEVLLDPDREHGQRSCCEGVPPRPAHQGVDREPAGAHHQRQPEDLALRGDRVDRGVRGQGCRRDGRPTRRCDRRREPRRTPRDGAPCPPRPARTRRRRAAANTRMK